MTYVSGVSSRRPRHRHRKGTICRDAVELARRRRRGGRNGSRSMQKEAFFSPPFDCDDDDEPTIG